MGRPGLRFLRSTGLRVLASIAAGLVVLATTAPSSGVTRCADGMEPSSCTSSWFTAVGTTSVVLRLPVVIATPTAAVVHLIVRAVRRRVPRGSAERG